MTKLFVRTLRDDPADAEVPSHRWLVRAGYIRRVAPGIYSWLPLGLRVLHRVEQVVRADRPTPSPSRKREGEIEACPSRSRESDSNAWRIN